MFSTTTTPLHEKHCVAIHSDTMPLKREAAEKLVTELGNRWSLNQKGYLHKEYRFNNFVEAMDFANKITTIAERENHHPDLKISWGLCAVEIYTHTIHALSENDFILAAKIEQLK